MQSKAELRADLLKARRARPGNAAAAFANAVFGLLAPTDQAIALYNATKLEPPTNDLIKKIAKDRNVFLPIVSGDDLLWVKNPKEFALGAFNILEPQGPAAPINNFPEISVLVIPAFAVSRSGIRLGKGGGFYDRLLSKLETQVKKIVLVFDNEIFEEIPHEPHDQKVDFIVSEKRVLPTV